MKSTEIQKNIDSLNESHVAKCRELDAIILEFARELPPHVQRWIENCVRKTIEKNASTFQTFLSEEVKEMKGEVRALYERLPGFIQTIVTDKSEWPHYKKKGNPYHDHHKEHYFNRVFRTSISEIASLLNKYNLIDGDHTSWHSIGNGKFLYAINPWFEPEKISSIEKYRKAKFEFDRFTEDIAIKKDELAKAKAKELWDSQE